MIIDAECDERHNRRIEQSITNARFHYKSNIESINFDQSLNIDRILYSGLQSRIIFIKWRKQNGFGFKSFESARRTLNGIEVVHMLIKIKWLDKG